MTTAMTESTPSTQTNDTQRKGEDKDDKETAMLKQDPTLPARSHGNEPSKGAKIDAEIAEEEQEMLKKKGAA